MNENITEERFAEVERQVGEVHAFCVQLSQMMSQLTNASGMQGMVARQLGLSNLQL
ncbi:hypothetical protein Toil_gp22 [Rhodococcus phage Toil]|uniref:Uncharacterized protein n=1 Tax=Rhodococcus phage Toil TaxID=1975614 RepID=A0A1W6DXT7_9VIRU|nr:hypothetical protein KMD62_gp22 [Rhodococcus phage Toil]ARK07705.1 hypothetical protein Toil_gp22 [Rhodococcus phage Toil]